MYDSHYFAVGVYVLVMISSSGHGYAESGAEWFRHSWFGHYKWRGGG